MLKLDPESGRVQVQKCQSCGKYFKDQAYLNEHIRKKHENVWSDMEQNKMNQI